jgi:hypothetical protein
VGIWEWYASNSMLWHIELDLFLRTCATFSLVHCDFTCLKKIANFIWVFSNEIYFILCLCWFVRNQVKLPNLVFSAITEMLLNFPKKKNWSEVFQIICLASQEGILCLYPIDCLFLSLGHSCQWFIPLKLLKEFLLLLCSGVWTQGPTIAILELYYIIFSASWSHP